MAKKAVKPVEETNAVLGAIEELAKEKKINKEVLFSKIEAALVSAYKKEYGKIDNVSAVIDRGTGNIEVIARKTIVEQVTDDAVEVSLTEVRSNHPELSNYDLGDLVEVPTMPAQFGRIAAQTAKQVIMQAIREAEKGSIVEEFADKEHEILTAIVDRVEPDKAYVQLGRTFGILEKSQMIPGEEIKPDDRIKVYVMEVNKSLRDSSIVVSRIHPSLVKRLFELEVPEIRNGEVLIKSITREAGSRTKMAVASNNRDIDPVGACIGPRNTRVDNVVNELKMEKVDIIRYSADPKEYVAAALSPARVNQVFITDGEKIAHVVVPDNQLSLAIGKEGQNARLAARLTGWKIDIKSQSQYDEAVKAQEEAEGENA